MNTTISSVPLEAITPARTIAQVNQFGEASASNRRTELPPELKITKLEPNVDECEGLGTTPPGFLQSHMEPILIPAPRAGRNRGNCEGEQRRSIGLPESVYSTRVGLQYSSWSTIPTWSTVPDLVYSTRLLRLARHGLGCVGKQLYQARVQHLESQRRYHQPRLP